MLIFGYVACLLVGLAAIAIFYEHRRKRFEPEPTEDHIFRCQDCAFVYTDDPDVERSRCPQCGKVNEQYQF
jgi:predicted Zn-ribbon and HTH transcriptional regulator